MLINLLLVALGGASGSVLRYLCQKWINESWQHSFPLATFLINIFGCLLIGIFYALGEKTDILTPQTRLMLVTGFCGGFTTFSTFAFENVGLLRSGDQIYFLLYTAGSVIFGILAVFAGNLITKII
ncbi:MAG: fluoride efflux transporter CrcB [Flavisolibacter sp.]